MMWIFPLAAALVAGGFAAMVGQSYVTGRKPHNLAWSVALLMFAIAAFSAAMGMLGGWTPFIYKIFFFFGVVANVPVLGLGTLFLLTPRRLALLATLVVVAASIFVAGALYGVSLNDQALAVSGRIPRASRALAGNEIVPATGRYMSYAGFFTVVAGALWSAWRLARSSGARIRRVAMANILIALGTTVVAAASALLTLDNALGSALFSVGLLGGISVMFAGFLKARPPSDSQRAEAREVGEEAAAAESTLASSEPESEISGEH